MRFVLALLSGLATTLPAWPQDEAGRERVDIASPPWTAVGQVNTAAYGRCTGVLVAPQLAVTAAHCLYNTATKRFLAPGSVHVVLGYDRGSYSFRTVASAIRLDPNQDGTRALAAAPRDWAVLVLADPAPASIRPMPVARDAPPVGAALTAAGFGRDRAYALTVARDCRHVGPLAPDLLGARCAIVQGYSGGPVLNEAGELVGIAVATAETREGAIALAVASGAWRAALDR